VGTYSGLKERKVNEELYTPQEVADILRIKKSTVYEMIKRGEFKCKKIGRQFRIGKADLDNYLNNKQEDTKREEANNKDTIAASAQTAPKQATSFVRREPVPSDYDGMEELDMMKGRNIIICGQDILLEALCNHLAARLTETAIFRSYKGSYNGLYDLYQDKVDVATAHLWDGDTGEYNKEYVRRMLPGTFYRRIHLVCRTQGFYVGKGNPKAIKSFADLTREDVVMVNREKGSGTRILLDEYLRKLAINKAQIKGYNREVTSHLACAGAVARGSADVSLGIERVSKEMAGLEFVPIQTESYDLVVKEEAYRTIWFQNILEILNSKEFHAEVDHMSGYDNTDMGKILE
jgi:putative molybdopterin biosynthesis protein